MIKLTARTKVICLLSFLVLATLPACASTPQATQEASNSSTKAATSEVIDEEPSPEALEESLRRAATEQLDALISGDAETYVAYMYPGYVEYRGGAEKIIGDFESAMEEEDGEFLGYALKDFENFVEEGGDIQTIFTTVLDFEAAGEAGSMASRNVAISSDEGKTWTFLEIAPADVDYLRMVYPNFSPALEALVLEVFENQR